MLQATHDYKMPPVEIRCPIQGQACYALPWQAVRCQVLTDPDFKHKLQEQVDIAAKFKF